MKYWWRFRTLRLRLVVWYGVGGMFLLSLFSATLYLHVETTLARPLDHRLRLDLSEVKRRLAIQPEGHLLWDGRELGERVGWDADSPWFEIWDGNGALVRRLWPFEERRVERLPSPPAQGRETISVFSVAEDIRLRVLSVPVGGPRDESWMLRVLTLHEPVGDALAALRWIIVISLPCVVALLALGGYVITRRWIQPLEHMVAEATQISAKDLSRRLPVTDTDDELGQLASVFNATLDRLERSFTTLERFVADASHELRTPLTTLHSVGEVGLRRGRTVEEYREIIGSMLEESQRLQVLIQRLLELATAEGGATRSRREPLELDELVTSTAAEVAILAEHKGQELRLRLERVTVSTDAVLLRQALLNLLENAIKYNGDGAIITVKTQRLAGNVRITVADEGPGIKEEARERLADRFFRADRGRAGDPGGVGLGLAITKAYLRLLGGQLDYENVQPHGSRFHLTIPRSAS